MAETEPLVYDHAYIAQGNGDLAQVTDFRLNYTNKGKLVQTQRGRRGVVKGKPEVNVSFNGSIDEDGIERDYAKLVQQGTIKQLRAHAPGGDSYVVDGMYTTFELNGPLEDATAFSATFIGFLAKR